MRKDALNGPVRAFFPLLFLSSLSVSVQKSIVFPIRRWSRVENIIAMIRAFAEKIDRERFRGWVEVRRRGGSRNAREKDPKTRGPPDDYGWLLCDKLRTEPFHILSYMGPRGEFPPLLRRPTTTEASRGAVVLTTSFHIYRKNLSSVRYLSSMTANALVRNLYATDTIATI